MTKLLILTLYGTALAWISKPGHYLGGYTSKGMVGGQHATLDEAKKQCLALPATDCGGITEYKELGKTWFQLRKGPTPATSPTGENSWLRPVTTTGNLALLMNSMTGGINIQFCAAQSETA